MMLKIPPWGTAPAIGDLEYLSDSDTCELERVFAIPPRTRPSRRRFSHHYWETYSPKLDRRVGLYGKLVYDHWIWVEADSTISWFSERAARFVLRTANRATSHVFDMVIKRRGGPIECRRVLNEEKTDAADWDRINNERDWCASVGVGYEVITKEALAQNRTLIENWKDMLPYIDQRRHPLDERVLGYVSAVGELTLAELDALLADFDATEARGVVYGLLHQGRLVAPELEEVPLSANTTVRINHG